MTPISNPNTPSKSLILIPIPLSSYFFLLQGGGEGSKFLGGDLVGEGNEGGGVLKGRDPSNPSGLIDSLSLLRGGEGVEGVGWDAS